MVARRSPTPAPLLRTSRPQPKQRCIKHGDRHVHHAARHRSGRLPTRKRDLSGGESSTAARREPVEASRVDAHSGMAPGTKMKGVQEALCHEAPYSEPLRGRCDPLGAPPRRPHLHASSRRKRARDDSGGRRAIQRTVDLTGPYSHSWSHAGSG